MARGPNCVRVVTPGAVAKYSSFATITASWSKLSALSSWSPP